MSDSPRTARDAVIEVTGLRMQYGSFEAVRSVDLRVMRGEVFALLGPNGAGKTSTVEILEGYRRRSGGEVSVLGQDPEHAGPAWRARIGVVLQASEPERDLTVDECLRLYAGYYPARATSPRRWRWSACPTEPASGLRGCRAVSGDGWTWRWR